MLAPLQQSFITRHASGCVSLNYSTDLPAGWRNLAVARLIIDNMLYKVSHEAWEAWTLQYIGLLGRVCCAAGRLQLALNNEVNSAVGH
jgi:hypothetical protein